MKAAAVGRRRPLPTRTDYEALRRGLTDAGLDPDYFSFDDIDAMWAWGYSVERIVNVARQREEQARKSA